MSSEEVPTEPGLQDTVQDTNYFTVSEAGVFTPNKELLVDNIDIIPLSCTIFNAIIDAVKQYHTVTVTK